MKKLGKSSKKGFTLVELIVVLVILAVLAAMLVPALVGYIDRARAEKEYQTAATVYAAAQAVITEKYAKDTTLAAGSLTKTTKVNDIEYGAEVIKLAGVDSQAITAFTFNYASDYIIGSQPTAEGSTKATKITGDGVPADCYGSVEMANATYYLSLTNGVPSWTAVKKTTTT